MATLGRSKAFVVLVAGTLGAAGAARADVINGTLDADARINQGSPDANFGSESLLTVRANTAANTYKSYLRFTLPDLPDGAQVTAVTLSLTAVNSGANTTVAWWNQNISVFGLKDAAWDESTVTWNNAPSNNTGSTSGFISPPAEALTTFNGNGTTGTFNVSFTSAAALAWFQDAADGGTVTLMLGTSGGSNQLIGSGEIANAAFRPTLAVTYVVPEPGTLALAAMAGSAVLGRRRAK